MTDILDLDGWTVLSKRRADHKYELEAEYTVQPTACQKCGVVGRLYRHGTKETSYLDSPIRGHATRILARVQRYKCRDCGETFLQPLAGIQEDRRMTERCATYIKEQCLRDTFTSIADHIGCDDRTVRNLAGEHIATLEAAYKPALPAWLGIDETQIDGKMRCENSARRCESCRGVFEPGFLSVHLTPAVVPGEHRKGMLLCANCHRRFHTEDASGHASDSTH